MSRILKPIAVVIAAACTVVHANQVLMGQDTNDGSLESWSSVLTNAVGFGNGEEVPADGAAAKPADGTALGRPGSLEANDAVVFLGDSITARGTFPEGYLRLVSAAISNAYPSANIKVIGAGIGGNKVTDCQERLDRDVLQKNPDVVVIYIGINDVWHWTHPRVLARGGTGTSREDFESGLLDLIGRVSRSGARVILCTPSVIGEKPDGTNPSDRMLDEYSDISRKVAKQTGVQLLDIRKEFITYLAEHNPGNAEKGILTWDSVHMNSRGNRFLSGLMLDALGVPTPDSKDGGDGQAVSGGSAAQSPAERPAAKIELERKKTDISTLVYHARELRRLLYDDPYRPKYHFVPPEGLWNDVNGMIYWKGRYHIFYLSRTVDPELAEELKKIKGQRVEMETWGHSSSMDLVHWIHHPFALVPAYDGSMPKGIFSGDMMDNMEVPTIIAHVPGQGTCIWQAEDDMLIDWKPLDENPVIPEAGAPDEAVVFDACGWKEGDSYYALIGNRSKAEGYEGDSSSLFTSKDLTKWDYVGPFYKSDRKWTEKYTDAACIDFFPLGKTHMLVTHVHEPYMHSQYYLGHYNKGQSFIPEAHGLFAAIQQQCMAPETMLDGKGRRLFMAWHLPLRNFTWPAPWRSFSTLPRVFSVGQNGELEQRPAEELKTLRFNHCTKAPVVLDDGAQFDLAGIRGTCLELGLTIKPGGWEAVGVNVLQAADGSEKTAIGYDSKKKVLYVDFSKSTKGVDGTMARFGKQHVERYEELEQEVVSRQELPLVLADGEDLSLRIFIDQAVVEVFANNRQVLVQDAFPAERSSDGVSLFAEGGAAEVSRIESWDLHWTNAF